MNKIPYSPPTLKVVSFYAEQGFAGSLGGFTLEGFHGESYSGLEAFRGDLPYSGHEGFFGESPMGHEGFNEDDNDNSGSWYL